MTEPLDSLAFSMHSAKGVYAVLLGSGVSRSAAIPTGWDIILNLVRKLAALRGVEPEPDPETWFQTTYGEPPSYSVLLDKLGRTPAERQAVLKGYIEPSDDDREAGRKTPTKAHRAIARLAAQGHVRVILTTNFDRLLESALEAEGVSPQVVSSPDAAAGMTPLPHAPVTVIKLHGDYLDARIKNTIAELEAYDPRLDRLLDRILDEFGLVVCGWSGDWDTALRAAVERCPNRRYATYWAAYREPTGRAAELVRLRAGSVIPNVDADTFFTSLAEKVSALEEYARPHPLSTAAAVAALKRYIPDPVHRIRLEDMVRGAVDRLVSRARETHIQPSGRFTYSAIYDRAKQIEAMAETTLSLLVEGCYWGGREQIKLWASCIERMSLLYEDKPPQYTDVWENFRLYAALLGSYAAGLSAVAAGKYETLRQLLYGVQIRDGYRGLRPGVKVLDVNCVLRKEVAQSFAGLSGRFVPASDYLHAFLRPLFRAFVPSDQEYGRVFDRFEYYRGLVSYDLGEESSHGRYWWHYSYSDSNSDVVRELDAEIAKEGDHWPGFRAGMFNGSKEQFTEARRQLVERIERSGMC